MTARESGRRFCQSAMLSLRCLAFLPLAVSSLRAAPPAATLSLHDGATLSGWHGNTAIWKVADGAITGEITSRLDRSEWLWWHGTVHDFEFTCEFRITGHPSANSGIQIRSHRAPDGTASGLECDLDQGRESLGRMYDEHGRGLVMERGTRTSIAPDGRTAADPFAAPESFRTLAPPDTWNHYRIVATGPHTEVWINDTLCGMLDDHESGKARLTGQLALQMHAGPGPARIQFRHLRLRHLGETPPVPASAPVTSPEKNRASQPRNAGGSPLPLDFESGSLSGWTATGKAFADQPIKGDTVTARGRGQRSNHAGQWWVGGFERSLSDAPTGSLTSAPFPASHAWASFLIGGGSDPRSVRAEIVAAETGKVFHTAAGNDAETMRREIVDLRPLAGNPIFIRLIDDSSSPWGHLNFDDFLFHDTAPDFPETARSRQQESPVLWHLQPNPAPPGTIGNPSARQTVAGMMLTHGFKAELIAAEPDVVQPIAFSIDQAGRLWILEGLSYPNKKPEGKGRDRIVVLGDGDGNGSFETRTVFMEGLNLASGIETGFGGVFVGAAPELLFIPDRNGDLVPDGPPEVLLDGWGFQDTHETLNSFSWGPDGWLYGCQGVFTSSRIGPPGSASDQRTPLHAGVWRFHPVSRKFEVFAHGGSNQWGLDYNEYGHFFMTHCRSFFGGGGTTCVIRHGHFWNQANQGYAPFLCSTAPDFAPALRNYLPASARYDSGEGGAGKPGSTSIFGGHSHIGTLIYQGTNWPSRFRGHLFTHNLHGHQINHQQNVRRGSAYETLHAGADLAFTPDPRYMGVDLQSGPDGAVYIIDWFDQQHCHTPIEEKWDRSNGRVYRLAWAENDRPVKVNLASLTDQQLAELQQHEDVWYRRHARRLLMERAAAGRINPAAIAFLTSLAGNPDAVLALRGLWSLHQCAQLSPDLLAAAATHPHEAVRAWAVQLGTESSGPRLPSPVIASLAADDPSAMVKLAIASALPNLAPSLAWTVVASLASHAGDQHDRFLPKMIWCGLAPLCPSDWPRAFRIASRSPLQEISDSMAWFAAQQPDGRPALAEFIASLPPDAAGRTIRIAAFALQQSAPLPPPQGLAKAAAAAGPQPAPEVKAAMDELAALFGDTAVLAGKRKLLADTTAPMRARKAAFALLARMNDAEALPLFRSLLDDPEFRSEVIPLLARSPDPATAEAILARYPQLPPAERSAALNTLTSRPAFALALVSAMAKGTFPKTDLTALHLRQMQQLGSPELNDALTKTWGRFNPTSDSAKATVARFSKIFREAPLWAYDTGKGREVFQKVCASCHAHGGGEAKIGPDLGGTWSHGAVYFLENIADPSAVIGDAYQLTTVTRNDGSVTAGAIAKESPESITLRTITESVTIPNSQIKSRETLAQSLMPPGLLEALSERQVIELLKFLTAKP